MHPVMMVYDLGEQTLTRNGSTFETVNSPDCRNKSYQSHTTKTFSKRLVIS